MLHASNGGGHNLKTPFMTGSLLQQRVEAEKQEIENLKMQLKMREQAGVLGSRNINNTGDSSLSLLSPGLLTTHYQQGGHGRGLSSTSSATSISSATSPYTYQQQQQQLQSMQSHFSPKFGGPGTLIEQGEVRAAQLSRSKSAGTGLLRPTNGGGNNSGTSSNGSSPRSRSRSRGPGEDRVAYGRPISPSSPRSPDFAPPVPQGPLLQFAHADAMIQPGLLLDRARSTKQPSYSNQMMSSSSSSQRQQTSAGSRRPGPGQSQSQSRGRVKPLIDLGNIHTGPDVIGPGLLTNGSNNYTTHNAAPSGSHAHSSRSPRRPKPLLDF
ncbi:hypothetical protein EC957_010517 [Mortierella hygrophila]|uniref:Uncharacterized protein n=1 Tax=Mortierella hygrophila TaxID=979708 RepID=A0A9P6F9S9_9FUNG|nr:hypothetical protein EC957_010517 [Mortierella hygrophila]